MNSNSDDLLKPGIYTVTHSRTGRVYVGRTIDCFYTCQLAQEWLACEELRRDIEATGPGARVIFTALQATAHDELDEVYQECLAVLALELGTANLYNDPDEVHRALEAIWLPTLSIPNEAEREARREYQRMWDRSPTGIAAHRAQRHRQRAQEHGAVDDGTVTTKALRMLFLSWLGQCPECGKPTEPTIDHIVPLEKGGKHSMSNLRLICIDCNRSKRGNKRG